jgi:predicted transposase YdaD
VKEIGEKGERQEGRKRGREEGKKEGRSKGQILHEWICK